MRKNAMRLTSALVMVLVILVSSLPAFGTWNEHELMLIHDGDRTEAIQQFNFDAYPGYKFAFYRKYAEADGRGQTYYMFAFKGEMTRKEAISIETLDGQRDHYSYTIHGNVTNIIRFSLKYPDFKWKADFVESVYSKPTLYDFLKVTNSICWSGHGCYEILWTNFEVDGTFPVKYKTIEFTKTPTDYTDILLWGMGQAELGKTHEVVVTRSDYKITPHFEHIKLRVYKPDGTMTIHEKLDTYYFLLPIQIDQPGHWRVEAAAFFDVNVYEKFYEFDIGTPPTDPPPTEPPPPTDPPPPTPTKDPLDEGYGAGVVPGLDDKMDGLNEDVTGMTDTQTEIFNQAGDALADVDFDLDLSVVTGGMGLFTMIFNKIVTGLGAYVFIIVLPLLLGLALFIAGKKRRGKDD